MDGPSSTALMVCGFRARATRLAEPICDDPWAARLGGDRAIELADLHDEAWPNGEMFIGLRTAYIDRIVQSYDAPQVVILGAGLDSRAARLAAGDRRFFEIDHPDSQRYKRDRVAAIGDYPGDPVYVPCDFEEQDFLTELRAAGLADEPCVVVWEGVSYYLTEGAVRSTLSRIAQLHPESVLVYDYINKNMATGTNTSQADDALRKLLGQVGEPFRFGTNHPTPLLAEAGFRFVRTVSFDDVCLDLLGDYDRERRFRFQGFVVASVGRRIGP